MTIAYWVYLNRVHKYAKVHRGDCVFCDHGAGLHHRGAVATNAGRWLGPFQTSAEAMHAAQTTGREPSSCTHCSP